MGALVGFLVVGVCFQPALISTYDTLYIYIFIYKYTSPMVNWCLVLVVYYSKNPVSAI